jgi:L-histidine N-alpha-methyltransferase
LVDLGAGDELKTIILLREGLRLKRDVIYRPIDISQGSNEQLQDIIKEQLPNAQATILTGEHEESLKFIGMISLKPSLITMLGPNIGNYTRNEVKEFLKNCIA